MRQRWLFAAATIPLAAGLMLAAAGPAGASSSPDSAVAGALGTTSIPGPGGPVQPGGPVAHLLPTASSSGGASSAARTNGTVRQSEDTSTNWAGYAATGHNGAFTSVAASWTEPTGNCASESEGQASSGTYGAFWVGLDGYTSPSVEQVGSEVDCTGQTPQYYAWYEMYPDSEVTISEPVNPGDKFSGSVSYQGNNLFQLVLSDSTEHWTKTVSQTLASADRSSAEIIAEAPCCTATGGVLPLTNFGSISYTSATVNGSGLCNAADLTEITIPNEATVSPVSGCTAFTASYTQATAPTSPPWPFGGQGGRGGGGAGGGSAGGGD